MFVLVILTNLALPAHAQQEHREFYEIKIYFLRDKTQETQVDVFIKSAFLPACHKQGIKNIGVFKPVESDSTSGKRIFLLIPYQSLDEFAKLPDLLNADAAFNQNGNEYLNAAYNSPPYQRIESIILRAFTGMTNMATPGLTGPRSERIYELRSYEGATEKRYKSKVDMFNVGDEISLFKRLGFNAVFYAEVISGGRMPNLMYMTTFANQASHDERWKAFFDDAHWKKLLSMPEYQHNVSKVNIYLLRPTDYSDY
jgi:hypothetical protein